MRRAACWLLICGLVSTATCEAADDAASGSQKPDVQDAPDAPDASDSQNAPNASPFSYVLGASVDTAPECVGASAMRTRLTPVFALNYGRWRISNGNANALMGFGRQHQASGAGADLLQTGRLRLGVSLGLDGGRNSKAAPQLAGLPSVKRTVRAQLTANYSLASELNLSATASTDMLGHGGGTRIGLGLQLRLFRSASNEWTAGVGLDWGDSRYQNAYFGVVNAAVAQASAYPVYRPGAGLRDSSIGTGWTHAFSAHWIAFSDVAYGHLQGPSAASPFVEQRSGMVARIGLAYRSR